jgi:hypothetical protein
MNTSNNYFFTNLLTIIYILFITKLSEVIAEENNTYEKNIDEAYSFNVFLFSIIGLIVGRFCFKDNPIIKNTLYYGSIIPLIYVILFYWNCFNNYYKLFILFVSFIYIITFID